MNEESKPSIEPELEARIVALVLGEASDFEREELNRLIELRPELAAFKVQMQSVHGLLQDVGTGEFDAPAEEWKLSADKRNAVLAVIRGEATVQTATQVVDPSAQSVSAERSLRWRLTQVAAFVCIAGFVGLMTLSFAFRSQSTLLPELASFDATRNKEPLSGGTRMRYEIDAGAGVAGYRYSRSARGDADLGKNSEVALSAIQDTLNAAATLPSAEYRADDIQYNTPNSTFMLHGKTDGGNLLVDNAEQGSLNLQDDVNVQAMQDLGVLMLKGNETDARHDVSGLGKSDLAAATPESGATSAPQDGEIPELIASGTWSYKGLASPLAEAGNSDHSLPMAATSGGEVSEFVTPPSIAVVPDGGTVLLGAIRVPSTAGSKRGGESGAPLSTVTREYEDLDASGMTQGVADGDRLLSIADVTSPEGESMRGVDFDFNIQDVPSQSSGPGQGQAELFFKQRMAAPAGEESDRFEDQTKWMENSDLAGSAEPAGGADKNVAAWFGSGGGAMGSGGRRFGRDSGETRTDGYGGAGSGGFGGGGGGMGGYGLNQPLTENSQEIPADANGIADGKMEYFFEGKEAKDRKLTLSQAVIAAEKAKLQRQIAEIEEMREKKADDALSTRNALELQLPVVDGFNSSGASANQNAAAELAELSDLTRLGSVLVDEQGRDESKMKSDELPRGGVIAGKSGTVQEYRKSYSTQTPAPVTGTTTVQPSVNSIDSIFLDTEIPPTKHEQQPHELPRQSGARGLVSDLNHRFRSVAPTRPDNSESTKRSTVIRITPTAGLNEKTAAAEAFSTFSLHVSDVSFKLSLAALGRGEWPEAAKVRIEEFVNAFDYGDPMPSRGEKVACQIEQSIHPFVQQRNLLRVSMRTAAAGRASSTPLRLTFLLDNSGSMERIDRQQTVRRAFALLAQQLSPIDQVTLISFARQPRLLADKVSGSEAGQLVSLIQDLPSEGGTNIEAALQLAFEKAREQQTPGVQNRIILLTDGAVNLGNANPESLSQMVIAMRSAGIAFDAAGISAEGLNDEVLEALTRKGDGRYYLLDSLEAADEGFARQIAGALRPSAKNVKVQVEFNPKRVGRYKLLGFEKHILKKEDFRNDKVDAAEMAAAEAGVAMYQFEAKPDGEGDVGSVSVRFLDLSTGQMIENRWPIPYEADAPRPDQAAPSLRIATSAALLAAKLRGEPLGESVDLQVLSHLMSGLPEQARHDNRVQQLQQMIEQARQLSGK